MFESIKKQIEYLKNLKRSHGIIDVIGELLFYIRDYGYQLILHLINYKQQMNQYSKDEMVDTLKSYKNSKKHFNSVKTFFIEEYLYGAN